MRLSTQLPLSLATLILLCATQCKESWSTEWWRESDDRELSQRTVERINAAVESQISDQNLAGVAVGIIQNGKVVFLKGYGFADLEMQTPVDESTIFNWASNSKPIVAVAAMQLVEQGKLDLDSPIREHVPEWPEKEHPVTVRQILCHQSGIPHYRNGRIVPLDDQPLEENAQLDPVYSIRRFAGSPLIFEPGDRESYSSYAYVLLSAVVQRAGGAPIADQLRERIYEPCELDSFQLDVPYREQPNWTKGYARNQAGELVAINDFAHFWKHGAGGYKSDIGDFANWANVLMSDKLLLPETKEIMWKNQSTNDGELQRYALGFRVSKDNGSFEVSHGGSQDETRTQMTLFPKEQSGIVVMCNTSHASPVRISDAVRSVMQEDPER